MIKNKRILLTGGAGFIGSKLCQLLHADNEILIYDSFVRNSIKSREFEKKDNIRIVKGDILESNLLNKIFQEFRPQIVVHMAAVAGIDTVIKSPTSTMKINMIGTANMLEACMLIKDELERVVDFSTSEVFGSYAYKVGEESLTSLAPVGEARWTYSVSKLAGEHLSYAYYKEFGIPVVSVRPFNVYGPGQVGEGAVHNFVKRAIANEDIIIHGEGDQIRSWCYIEDFVSALILCLEKEEAIGEVFNIGNPRGTTTINDLAEKVLEIADSKSKVVHVQKNFVDVELRIPNVDKLKNILGFTPRYDLREGLKHTIAWYKELNTK